MELVHFGIVTIKKAWLIESAWQSFSEDIYEFEGEIISWYKPPFSLGKSQVSEIDVEDKFTCDKQLQGVDFKEYLNLQGLFQNQLHSVELCSEDFGT